MRTRHQTRLIEELVEASENAGSLIVNEEVASTTSTKDATPQRKKRMLVKPSEASKVKKSNKIKGKLSGILSLPIEVFVEIMRHLALPDVLSLSRSNKFFRQMLMTRSVTTLSIWRGAIESVPGLPPCPEDLCEPQYAALVYTKYCSMCGTRIVMDMDPYLNVRICKDCVEIHVTRADEVDDEIRHLIPESRNIRKAGRYGIATCLTRDVAKVEQWYYNDLPAGDHGYSEEEWEAKLDEGYKKVRDRTTYAQQMKEFLRHMAKTRTEEIDLLKEQRRQDIKRRLQDAGWEERDWIFPEFVARKWSSLVESPQALTERAWQKLYPSMVPYLEQNRRWRTQRSKLVRKGKRLRRMRRLLVGIRNQSYLLEANGEDMSEDEDEAGDDSADAAVSHMSSSGDEFSSSTEDEFEINTEKTAPLTQIVSYTRIKAPFPPMVDLLEWPIIANLLDTDTDADTMQEKFEELKEDIEAEIRSWGSTVEDELISSLKVGSTDEIDLDSDVLLQLQAEGASVDWLTPSARLLLRADSVFRIAENDPLVAPMPLYFSEIFTTLQSRPDGYSTSDFQRPGGHKRPKHGYKWDSSEVEYYPEGSTVAKALLKQLGRENAAQFELQALGARLTCGSCGDKWPRTWNEMVQHYAEAIVHANMAKKAKASAKKRIKYNNIHSLDIKAKRRPLLVIHSEEEAKVLSSKRRKFEGLVKCISCEQLGIDFESPRDIMLKHVRVVHIIKPAKAEHYKRTYNVRKHVRVYDPTGHVSDSTEATDQEFVKRIISGYASHGTCVFWSDYGRHADEYDGCIWHQFFDKAMY